VEPLPLLERHNLETLPLLKGLNLAPLPYSQRHVVHAWKLKKNEMKFWTNFPSSGGKGL
jgi:hypothetical protein